MIVIVILQGFVGMAVGGLVPAVNVGMAVDMAVLMGMNQAAVGRIVNVSAEESVLGENGKVDVSKLQPITYDPMNHHYLVLGEKVGQAFHDGLTLK